jgi:hypothetical protein
MTLNTEETPEEIWRHSLRLQQMNLSHLENDERSSAKEIVKARDRVERLWNQGRPEWRVKGRSRLP